MVGSLLTHAAFIEGVGAMGDTDHGLQWIELLERNGVAVKKCALFIAVGVVVILMLTRKFFCHCESSSSGVIAPEGA